MKTLSIALLLLFGASVSTTNYEDGYPPIDNSNLKVEVVVSYVGCEEEPGIYEITDRGRSKVVELAHLDKSDPSKHAANAIKVMEFLSFYQHMDYNYTLLDEVSEGHCVKRMTYLLTFREPAIL